MALLKFTPSRHNSASSAQPQSQPPTSLEIGTTYPVALQPRTGLYVRIPEYRLKPPASTTSPSSETTISPRSPSSDLTFPSPTSSNPLCHPPSWSQQRWSTQLFPDKPTCKLCLLNFSEASEKAIRMLPCGDIFHVACVDIHIGNAESLCPTCFTSIPEDWYVTLPLVYEDDELAKQIIFIEDSPAKRNPISRGLRKVRKRTRDVLLAAGRPFATGDGQGYTRSWVGKGPMERGGGVGGAQPLKAVKKRFPLD